MHDEDRKRMARRARIGQVYLQVQAWFDREALREVLRADSGQTEDIALDWLAKAGKRFRPFLVACMHLALRAESEDAPIPESIQRLAVAVECIHKGSLIYDDIQDADEQRYGEPAIHTVHGVPVALTSALLLLGWGYRLIGECGEFSPTTARMLHLAYQGHCELCHGQGGELCWMRDPHPLSAQEVLDIFRWKTAPSFDVVFRLPLIYHGSDDALHRSLEQFAGIVGVAYQVQDDLQDFHGRGDVDDIESHRPSIVLAYAHELATGAARERIATAWCGAGGEPPEVIRTLVREVGAVDSARDTLGELKAEAGAILAAIDNADLRDLLQQVMETILGVEG